MENPNTGGPIPSQEVRVELTMLSSMARAKAWAHSPSFLDKCTDDENRWFFEGREECWLVIKVLPHQIAGIRLAAHKAGMDAENAMNLTIAEVIEAVVSEELAKLQ